MGWLSKVMIGLFVLLLAGATIILYETPAKHYLSQERIALPIIHSPYILQQLSTPILEPELNLPDLSLYTHRAVLKKVPPVTPAMVRVRYLSAIKEIEKFSEKDRLAIFSRMQKRQNPVIIMLEEGIIDLASLVENIDNPDLIEQQGDIFHLKVPLLVGPGATLLITGTKKNPMKIHMSSITGGFLVNAGDLFIIHADLSGWNEQKNDYAWFEEKKIFRPFFAAWSGSETYISKSIFRHMGYAESKSYGLTFSIDNDMLKVRPNLPRPTGWIIDSLFDEIYYGYYSYEADDMAIIGNTYKDNIVYGIDPHDRSNRLIIAYNEAFGTKERHGIIISREVNDGWIIYNKSHNNSGAGFMLDRNSTGNVVAFNESYENGSDGLTLFESPHNILYKNKLYKNKKSGIRMRNSWDVMAYENNVYDNGGVGFVVYASELISETRDFEEDPYIQRASLILKGGRIQNNQAGSFKFENFELFQLSDINILDLNNKSFRKDLEPFKRYMLPALIAHKNGLEIQVINPDTP